MKAWVLHGEKDIRLEERDTPKPAAGEVLVGMRAAGICGSDLHYHAHGRCGNFVPTRPFILGHEFAGEIVAVGEGVEESRIGERVAIDPSRPCGTCRLCREGRYNLCPEMVYFGSASVVPPSEGCFSEFVAAPARNAWRLPEGFDYSLGALLEPMSVSMHAVQRSGGVAGKPVLITGGGTIGQMILLCANACGASRVVVSDPRPFARDFAIQQGAAGAIDPTAGDVAHQAKAHAADGFEVVFEAAGVGAALRQGMELAAKGATVVQVGTLPDGTEIPANLLLTRELDYKASWRFANVFERVIDLIESGKIDPKPLISGVYPMDSLPEAIEQAGGGGEVVKIQIKNPA
ncbi:MAG: NAD(P)-dependent alcohol dehydrogenase [Akkermansiaceae bacterium]|nr:NAD(P)-dependent alcohol dehydrogenase [Akkermansiaceae bacterium]